MSTIHKETKNIKDLVCKHWIVLVLIFISFLIKLYFISDDFIYFWFDQARDATVSRAILEQADLKIQGPSASGTNDQIYHGVLYYYLIGPVYTLFNGNPRAVSVVISWLTSLFVIPVFLLTKSLTKSKSVAVITSLLSVVCLDVATTGVWLSNPVILLVSVPLYFYYLWQVFFQQRYQHLWLVAVTLGVSNQAALSSIYLFVPLLWAYLYQARQQKKLIIWSWQRYLILVGIYLLSISTMILTQAKMYLDGSFDPSTISSTAHVEFRLLNTLKAMGPVFLRKIELTVLPGLPVLSVLIFACLLGLFIKHSQTKTRLFYALYLLAVPIFMLLHFRDAHHGLIGLSPMILLPIGFGLAKLWQLRRSWSRFFAVGLIIFYAGYHLNTMRVRRQQSYYELTIQKGFMLRDQLALIDHTYQLAQGEPFSITTLTIPFGWNTTWGYLYDWYGMSRHGYKPSWFGPSQAGVFGSQYLAETDQPDAIHFTIYEPEVGLPKPLEKQFQAEQNAVGSVVQTAKFSQLLLETRYVTPTSVQPEN